MNGGGKFRLQSDLTGRSDFIGNAGDEIALALRSHLGRASLSGAYYNEESLSVDPSNNIRIRLVSGEALLNLAISAFEAETFELVEVADGEEKQLDAFRYDSNNPVVSYKIFGQVRGATNEWTRKEDEGSSQERYA